MAKAVLVAYKLLLTVMGRRETGGHFYLEQDALMKMPIPEFEEGLPFLVYYQNVGFDWQKGTSYATRQEAEREAFGLVHSCMVKEAHVLQMQPVIVANIQTVMDIDRKKNVLQMTHPMEIFVGKR